MENQEFVNEINSYENNTNIKKIFEHPIVKTLLGGLGIIPYFGSAIGAAIDSNLNAYLIKEEEKRLLHICEIIISDKNITSDMVKDVKEIISFAKMLDVARKLITNEKLDYLARLYKNMVSQNEKNYCEFEEYLCRLDELSYREIDILHILDDLDLVIEDVNMSKQKDDNNFDEECYHLQIQQIESKWLQFQEIVWQKFEIDALDLQGYMQSMCRSGFCVRFNDFFMPVRSNGIYAVTKYYIKFANMIYK